MNRRLPNTAPRRAFTLVEAVFSMLIVSVMLVAALNTVGASQRSQRYSADRATALLLAEDLMSEILATDYRDESKPENFGVEPDESTAHRREFDDVDDFDGWAKSPPVYAGGAEMSDVAGFGRSVEVSWRKSESVGDMSASDTGIKVIVVTVTYNKRIVQTLTAVRTGVLDLGAAKGS